MMKYLSKVYYYPKHLKIPCLHLSYKIHVVLVQTKIDDVVFALIRDFPTVPILGQIKNYVFHFFVTPKFNQIYPREGPYSMGHTVWAIQYGPYSLGHTVWAIQWVILYGF